MKRRSLTLTICILAVLALASIGFASWIITNPNVGDYEDGTIVVDDVVSEEFIIEATWATEGDNTIKFGVPSDYDAQPSDWLTNNSDNIENLEAELIIAVTATDGNQLESALTKSPLAVTLTGLLGDTELSNEDLNQKFTDAGLATPVILVKNSEGKYVKFDGKIDYADLNSSNQCELKIVFSWGTNGNPYTYYNDLEYNKENRDAAETFLKGVYTALNGLSYKITIK